MQLVVSKRLFVQNRVQLVVSKRLFVQNCVQLVVSKWLFVQNRVQLVFSKRLQVVGRQTTKLVISHSHTGCEQLCLWTPWLFFEEPPPGYAVLWYVSVGAAIAPVANRRGSWFIASSEVVDSAQRATDYLGYIDPVGTYHSSCITPPLQTFDPIELENKLFWDSFFNSIGSTCHISLALIYRCLLWDSFFDQSHETSRRFIKKVDLNRFDVKSFLPWYGA